MFQYPLQLCMIDLVDETLQSYVIHYIQHRFSNMQSIKEGLLSSPPNLPTNEMNKMKTLNAFPGLVFTPSVFTLSYLYCMPELALLASLVTNAETRWYAQSDVDVKQVGLAQKSSLNAHSCLSTTISMKMKYLLCGPLSSYMNKAVLCSTTDLCPPFPTLFLSLALFISKTYHF